MADDRNVLSDSARLLVAPDVQVRWVGGAIELTTPSGETLRVTDPSVLELLGRFGTPATLEEVRTASGAGPELAPRVEELRRLGILLALRPPATARAPRAAADPGGAGPLHVIFVLPPNLGRFGAIGIPSGVLVLATLVEQAGHTTDFWLAADGRDGCPADVVFAPVHERLPPLLLLAEFTRALGDRIEAALAAGRRPVLAVSCFSSALYLSTVLLGAHVRHAFPALPIAVGGHHPTIDPDSLLQVVGSAAPALEKAGLRDPIARDFLEELDAATAAIAARGDFVFDFLFRGRADHAFVEVLSGLQGGNRRPAAPRVIEAAPIGGEEAKRFRFSPSVLDRLAGPKDPARPSRRFDLCFSFGCPFRCTFCINSTAHERWHGLDVGYALEVIEGLHQDHGIDGFSVIDADFGASSLWRRQFFEGLAARPWARAIQLDIETSVMTFELPDSSVLDGFGLTLQVGVESCSEQMLLRMQKARDPALYKQKLVQLVRDVAPHVDLMGLLLIFGYPGETAATLRETLDFLLDDCDVLSHPNVALVPQLYVPLMGTEAARRTAQDRAEVGFEPNELAWWHSTLSPVYGGARPSRSLSNEGCARVAALLWDYYLGDVAAAAARVKKGEPPPITVKTKQTQRRLRAALRETLASLT